MIKKKAFICYKLTARPFDANLTSVQTLAVLDEL
jgi:hypothetical protein